ncbi:MAG: hypothetical protein JRI47_09535 [Deltaproteobacteria bacterium]|nr:hypothetical protein [Deltaproteobacteria bacterium]
MRKTGVVLALLLVMVFMQLSSAKRATGSISQLESLAQGLSENGKSLRETGGKTHELGKAIGDIYIAVLVDKIEKAELICHYSARLISFYVGTKDGAKKVYVADILSTLEMSKPRMEGLLKEITALQKYVPYPPALESINKAKASIESSIPLIDQAIEAFKSEAK